MAFPTIGAIVLAISALPTLVEVGEKICSWFDGDGDIPEEPGKRTKRKINDCTRFTQCHFDAVNVAHQQYAAWNSQCKVGSRMTQDQLAANLNDQLGLNKSTKAYSTLWNGTVKREDLAAGKVVVDDAGS